MKIYVGNLSYEVTEEDLRQEFEAFGVLDSVSLITDKYSGRSKGFAFVEMSSVSEGQNAIDSLNGRILKERTIVVNTAKPRTENRSRGSYSDRRSGGYGEGRSDRTGGGRQRRY